MTAPRTIAALDRPVGAYSESAHRVRQDLYYCDVNFARRSTRELRAALHAASYVYLAAALERVVTDLVAGLVTEINAAVHSVRDVRLSLVALVVAPQLDSLKEVRGLKMWNQRSAVFQAVDARGPCVLSDAVLPLDGRTIRADHFATIWSVFGFDGPSLPSPTHGLALRTLANNRNDVAHGEETPITVAGRASVQDTLLLLNRVEDVVLHLWDAATSYLHNSAYLR